MELKLAERLRESLIRWREWTSCLTFTEKHQGNKKHLKEGERMKGMRISIKENTLVYRNFSQVLELL